MRKVCIQNDKISTVKKVIQADLPNLKIKSIKIIPHGWDNIVAEINNEYIFRFPRDAGYKFDKEIHILRILKKNITLPIPEIKFIGKKVKYMAYKKIHGVHLTFKLYKSFTAKQKKSLVKDIANFLAELHALFKEQTAQSLGVKIELPYRNDKKYLCVIAKIENTKLNEFAQQIFQEIKKIQKQKLKITLLHNDLHLENFVINQKTKKISGIFDFGDVSLGDINLEFYSLFNAPWLIVDVMKIYEKITKEKLSMKRIITYAKANACRNLAHSIEKNNKLIVQKHIKLILNWDRRYSMFMKKLKHGV